MVINNRKNYRSRLVLMMWIRGELVIYGRDAIRTDRRVGCSAEHSKIAERERNVQEHGHIGDENRVDVGTTLAIELVLNTTLGTKRYGYVGIGEVLEEIDHALLPRHRWLVLFRVLVVVYYVRDHQRRCVTVLRCSLDLICINIMPSQVPLHIGCLGVYFGETSECNVGHYGAAKVA